MMASGSLPAATTAAAILFEHLWAKRFAAAIREPNPHGRSLRRHPPVDKQHVSTSDRHRKNKMIEILGQILPEALAAAIMPLSIIAIILMLSTPNARTNGIAFTIGSFAATLAILIVGALLGSTAASGEGGGPTLIASLLKTALGLVMLYLALKQWQARPKKGETVEIPGWMKALDKFTAGKSFATGASLAVVNPKNLPILLAVAIVITQSGLGFAGNMLVAVIFSLVVASLLIIPLVFYLIAGQKAVDALDGFKDWLIANNNTIMFILFLIVGAKILGQGIGGIF